MFLTKTKTHINKTPKSHHTNVHQGKIEKQRKYTHTISEIQNSKPNQLDS
jgi:hypothetical protein